MAGPGPGPARYRAFISYSHRDAAFGRRLHRRLERYALPARLVGAPTRWGPAPRRVAPVFRDREELAAALDLTTEVRAALAASGSLIVVCSPHAAASPWVAREVALFRELHPDRPVLAALVAGEPREAFPAPLRDGAEPLAADFRRAGDGERLALLKLVAGAVGVGLDQLVQRDAQRRLRTVTAVTAGALAGVLAMALLTAFALDARAEAERRRSAAEALVEFMLTDLRDRLEGVGRLDVLTAVNREVLGYYRDQDLGRLPPDALERRARLLHAMGEDDEKRGDSSRAMGEFQEARRTTAALLADAPDDPERMFGHAQSEYWIALIHLREGRLAEAKSGFGRYRALAGEMVRAAPGRPRYLRELAYAEGNLCTAALEKPRDPPAALEHCAAALQAMEAVASRSPGDPLVEADLVNRHAWLSDARQASGDLPGARAARQAQERLLARLMAADPRNMELKGAWVALQRAHAGLAFRSGDLAEARRRFALGRATVDEMMAFEPENRAWRRLSDGIDKGVAYLDQQNAERKPQ